MSKPDGKIVLFFYQIEVKIMERNPYIKESDLQREEHFPIYVFFNLIKEKEFLEVCNNFSKGIGQGIEVATCVFLNEADDKKNKTGRVEFSLHSGEEVVVNSSIFYWYFNKVCKRYVELRPDDGQKTKEYLGIIKFRFDT